MIYTFAFELNAAMNISYEIDNADIVVNIKHFFVCVCYRRNNLLIQCPSYKNNIGSILIIFIKRFTILAIPFSNLVINRYFLREILPILRYLHFTNIGAVMTGNISSFYC